MLVSHTVEIARLARQAAMIRRGGKLHLSLHLWLPQLEQAREPIQEEQVAERFQSCGKHHQYHQGVTRLAKQAATIRRGGKFYPSQHWWGNNLEQVITPLREEQVAGLLGRWDCRVIGSGWGIRTLG